MNHPDTRNPAASKKSTDPAPEAPEDPTAKATTGDVPKATDAAAEKSPGILAPSLANPVASPGHTPAKTIGSGPNPTAPKPVEPDPKPAASKPDKARDHVSDRIANPAPRRMGPTPGSLDEVFNAPASDGREVSPLRHLSDSQSSAANSVADGQPDAVAGGFSGINNWLDSLPQPELEQLGDKIYAAPSSMKASWRQRRNERAKTAELKEQRRLIEVAHVEAHREAGDREARALAHQARLEAQVLEAAHTHAKSAETERARAIAEAPEKSEAPEQPTATEPVVSARPTREPRTDPAQLAALVASAKSALENQKETYEPVYVAPYAVPEFGPAPAEEPADLRRRIILGAAALMAAVVSMLNLDTLASGNVETLGSNYSLLSIAPTAHLLWPVIFVWAALGAAYSWVPSQRSAVRQRGVGIPFALACVASTLWMLSALNSWLVPACVFAGASCFLLYATVRALNRKTARSRRERLLTDAPVCLMTGFSFVVLASTFGAMVQSWGAERADIWVAAVLVPVVGYASVALAMTERGRIILAIGFAWGMFWLLVPRAVGTNNSIWIAILAGMAAFVVLLATENRRYQIHHAEHRAARGKATDFS
ncbi:hypothetical protein [Paeniglutamicibacter antarcticus]|uniref:Membrane protein DUF2157 n=1 Tax=Paeniglutamicibacter antarcticus TaxID=494023 RepID=A0ABP9TM17_9MICC